MAKAPVSVDALEIATGKAKHAKLLARYVREQGVAAFPVLEQCIEGGSKRMKHEAWTLWSGIDLAAAEAAALKQAEGAEGLSKKARAERLEGLSRVQTTAALRRLKALGATLDAADLHPEIFLRAPEYLAESLDEDLVNALKLDLDGGFAFGHAQLERRDLGAKARSTLLGRLIDFGDLETCRRDDLPEAQHEAGALRLPPAECFDRLAPRVKGNAEKLQRLAYKLRKGDPRWVDVYVAAGGDVALEGLKHLGCPEAGEPLLAMARGLEWSQPLKEILSALSSTGHPKARELLMHWLVQPEAREASPLILTALRSCGQTEDVPKIRAAAKADPASAAFYTDAANAIEARGS